MAQDEHHRMPRTQFPVNSIQVFHFNLCRHLFQRHGREFDAAQKIGAQLLKMAAHQAAQLPRRFFSSKSDGNIASSQASITGKNEPGTEAEKLSQNEEER